ncbi:MAG: hypothetical protein IJ602_02260 [Paludibacteraceae bacterium]|nr:hypothetical protein [Paludibacteraceae bacterium]
MTGTIVNFDGQDFDFRSILQITEHNQVLVTVYDIAPDVVNQIREEDYCCACVKLDNGDYFSLFDVQVKGESYSIFPDHLPIKGTTTLLARYAIRGSNSFSANDTFAKFSAEITDGYELFGLCPYDVGPLIMDMFHRNPIHIPFNNPSIVSNISLGKITFAAYPHPSFSKDALSFGFQHQIMIDLNAPISPREFSKVLGPLTDFMSILCGEFVRINRLNLIVDTGEGRNDVYDFIGYCNYPRPNLKLLQGNGFDTTGYLRTAIFKISDFSDISAALELWLNNLCKQDFLLAHESYGRILMDEDVGIVTQNRFLAAMQLVEGYVSAFHSDDSTIAEFKLQKDRIISQLQDDVDKTLVEQNLVPSGFTFRRAVELFLWEGISIFDPSKIISKTQWKAKYGSLITKIVDMRNLYTHSSNLLQLKLDIHDCTRIASICKDLYRANMLRKMGLSDEQIKLRFSHSRAFVSYLETVFDIKLDFRDSLPKFDKDMWYFSDSEKVTR